jgi:hypothetical protein
MNSNNQSVINAIKKSARNSKLFPNLEVLGSYDEFSQSVVIDYMDENQFSEYTKAIKNFIKNTDTNSFKLGEDYELIRKFLSTCVHELTHWLDHTSTLWGQNHLILTYNAINAWANKNEYDFFWIVTHDSARNRAHLATYYTEEYEPSKKTYNVERWQYQFSCGLEFGVNGIPREDRPIIFTIFSNSQGERVIRIPFTVGSLTEANATYAEQIVNAQCFYMLSEDDKIVEENILKAKAIENIYNPKLAIYSVASHYLANILGINDIALAYKFSSALSTFCLNLPKRLFQYLKTPNEFSLWGERVEALKELYDPGFAYFSIIANAPKYSENLKMSDWIEEAIANSGLPNIKEISKITLLEMEELQRIIIDGKYTDKLKSLVSIGISNFSKRGIYGKNVLSLDNLFSTEIKLPPILLGDECIVSINKNSYLSDANELSEWLYESMEIEMRINNFLKACRY